MAQAGESSSAGINSMLPSFLVLPNPNLLETPLELLYIIVEDECIANQDIKNLRLVHSALANKLAPKLFTKVSFQFTTKANTQYDFKTEVDLTEAKNVEIYEPLEPGQRKQRKKTARELHYEMKQGKEDLLLQIGLERSEAVEKAKEERTPLKDRIKGLEKKKYNKSFTDVVRVLSFDIPDHGNSRDLDPYIEEFARKKYTVKKMKTWFSNLQAIHLKINIKSNHFLATKLMRSILGESDDTVSVTLELEGIGLHTSSLRQVRNITSLSVTGNQVNDEGSNRTGSTLLLDFVQALEQCPDLKRIVIDFPKNHSSWRSGEINDLNAIFGTLPDTGLSALKVLEIHSAVGCKSSDGIARLKSLEELSVVGYKPVENPDRWWWQPLTTPSNEKPQPTLWQSMATHGISLRALKIRSVDDGLLDYLGKGLCENNLSTLTIHLDSSQLKINMQQFEEKFWDQAISGIKPTLRILKVTSSVYRYQKPAKAVSPDALNLLGNLLASDEKDHVYCGWDLNSRYWGYQQPGGVHHLFLAVPYESGHLDQNFSDLKSIEVSYEPGNGALSKILTFFLAAENAGCITLNARYKDEFEYHERSKIKALKAQISVEVNDWGLDNRVNGNAEYKNGTILVIKILHYTREDQRPARTVKFVARDGNWSPAV